MFSFFLALILPPRCRLVSLLLIPEGGQFQRLFRLHILRQRLCLHIRLLLLQRRQPYLSACTSSAGLAIGIIAAVISCSLGAYRSYRRSLARDNAAVAATNNGGQPSPPAAGGGGGPSPIPTIVATVVDVSPQLVDPAAAKAQGAAKVKEKKKNAPTPSAPPHRSWPTPAPHRRHGWQPAPVQRGRVRCAPRQQQRCANDPDAARRTAVSGYSGGRSVPGGATSAGGAAHVTAAWVDSAGRPGLRSTLFRLHTDRPHPVEPARLRRDPATNRFCVTMYHEHISGQLLLFCIIYPRKSEYFCMGDWMATPLPAKDAF